MPSCFLFFNNVDSVDIFFLCKLVDKLGFIHLHGHAHGENAVSVAGIVPLGKLASDDLDLSGKAKITQNLHTVNAI